MPAYSRQIKGYKNVSGTVIRAVMAAMPRAPTVASEVSSARDR